MVVSMPRKLGGNLDVRSCSMPGVSKHIVQELNVGTEANVITSLVLNVTLLHENNAVMDVCSKQCRRLRNNCTSRAYTFPAIQYRHLDPAPVDRTSGSA